MKRRRILVPFLVLHGFAIFTWQLSFAERSAYEAPDSGADKTPGSLAGMERNADLVFKGKVISSDAVTNKAFPHWGNPHATKLGVITVLKGSLDTNEVTVLHITHGPYPWGGGSPPSDFILNPGASYIIFAARADKADYLYSPSSNSVGKAGDYRQLMRGIPAIAWGKEQLTPRPLCGPRRPMPLETAGRGLSCQCSRRFSRGHRSKKTRDHGRTSYCKAKATLPRSVPMTFIPPCSIPRQPGRATHGPAAGRAADCGRSGRPADPFTLPIPPG